MSPALRQEIAAVRDAEARWCYSPVASRVAAVLIADMDGAGLSRRQDRQPDSDGIVRLYWDFNGNDLYVDVLPDGSKRFSFYPAVRWGSDDDVLNGVRWDQAGVRPAPQAAAGQNGGGR